jgi:hypothetical protein
MCGADTLSEAGSSMKEADETRELDDIAEALYTVLPDAFAAARDDEIRKAREAGRPALARELSRLRRPTQSAWLVNQLARDQREAIGELLDLADELGRAQTQASIPELHRLTGRRRELESTLIRRGHALASRAGVNVTANMERDALETLAAALASPEVRAEVRAGRLVKPASYAGFGPFSAAPAETGRRAEEAETNRAAPAAAEQKPEHGGSRAAQSVRGRSQQAERRVQQAREAVDEAAGVLAEHARAAEGAQQHHQELREQIDELRDRLRDLQKEATSAEHAARAAARRRDEAERAHESALRTLERARQRSEERD